MPHVPRLSIVVPIYNVEPYLAECLDSILGQDFSDLEVIAVDDCSPDRCADILKLYEEADARVRVLSLKRNVGLGAARNAGLKIARGDYVWFLDSDDVVCPNKLSKIMQRADDTQSEVLLFGWVRFYEDGTKKWGGRSDLLAQAPARFTAVEWPSVMKLLQVAWNKIVRRDLLERTQLEFPDGFYEDTAFTYPLLASARSISAMPLTVVCYRQRTGAITATRSHRHFEIFAQWQSAMTRLAEFDEDWRLRTELYPLMIKHCTYILMGGRRLPVRQDREYLVQLRALTTTHAPLGGYQPRRILDAVELSLAKSGSLRLLRLLWVARSLGWALAKARSRGQASGPELSQEERTELCHRGSFAASNGALALHPVCEA